MQLDKGWDMKFTLKFSVNFQCRGRSELSDSKNRWDGCLQVVFS